VATVMLEPLPRRGHLGRQEENRPNITKSLTSDSSKIFTFWTEIMSAKSPSHSLSRDLQAQTASTVKSFG
jgi:hypothetical protein